METEGVKTRAQAAKLEEKEAKSKQISPSLKGSTATTSRSTSSTTSSSRARAAARKAKLKIQIEALKEKECIEREEMLMRQRREEQDRKNEELQLQNESQELEIMQRKRFLQLQVDLECAAAEHAAYEEDEEHVPNPGLGTINFECTPKPKESSAIIERTPKSEQYVASTEFVSKPGPSHAYQESAKPIPSLSRRQPDSKPCLMKPKKATTFTESTQAMASVPQPPQVSNPYLSQHHLLQGIASLKLPAAEVPIFSGEPIRYCYFINAFETLIENKEIDARQCLYYLTQHTRGMARNLVSSCLYIENSNEALERAKMLLRENYGQPYQITSAFISKLTDGPTLTTGSPSELQAYAVDLEMCLTTLSGIGCAHEINNQHVLRQIINRLPVPIQHKWRGVADNIMHEVKRYVSIEDIVHFVRKQAREINNPIFGVSVKRKPANQKLFFSSSNVKPIQKPTKSCPLCSAFHYLNQCKQFRNLSYKDRLKFVIDHNLCFACLNSGHRASACSRTDCCQKVKCTEKHTTLLHPPPPSDDNGPSTSAKSAYVGANANSATGVMLPIIPVKVRASCGEFVKTYAFLDPGSTTSFCTHNLVKELKLIGRKVQLKTTTISNCNEVTSAMLIQNLAICDLDENEHVVVPQCFSIKSLPISNDEIASKVDLSEWTYLEKVLVPFLDVKVGLLIGSDYPEIIQPHEVIPSQNGGPFAYKTLLGWAVAGPRSYRNVNLPTSFFIKGQVSSVCDMCSDMCGPQTSENSIENKRFLTQVNNSVVLKDNNHYEIALPLKHFTLKVPSNKELVNRRLMALKRKLLRDPHLHEDYVQCVNNMLANGYAEKVPEAGKSKDFNVWYIPHHGVYHPMKPKKVRVVFDCSARYHGFSLNDNLLQGPDLTNSLLGVLCRFRLEEVAIMGDIQAMFHQIEIPEKDRDMLRFLWWENGNLEDEPKEYRMKVYIFGAVCSPSCANFALRKTAEDNKSCFIDQASEAVFNNFYVDDCLVSTPDASTAVQLVTQLTNLLHRGGFHITKWVSNNDDVLRSIPETNRSQVCQNSLHLPTQTQETRALGLLWSTKTDDFHFVFNQVNKPCANRRQMLSIANSIYDPFGFLAPVMLPIKILQQELCRKGLSWDDEIDEQSKERFDAWIQGLSQLSSFKVSRCLKPSKFGKVILTEFHHFSDASEDAYGCVSYVKTVNKNDESHISLILAKCRLTPIQRCTIPRLELNAATISVKNDQFLRKELNHTQASSYFWTDSTTVLRYIHNESRTFKTFVANRVAYIRNNSDLSQWRYVPGHLNPADKATRGMSSVDFLTCQCWVRGPRFLSSPPEMWPDQPDFLSIMPEVDPELKQIQKVCHASASVVVSVEEIFSRYSDWKKLKTTIAWLLRYRNNLRKARKIVVMSKAIPPLTVDEMQESENQILKYLQRKYYADEMQALTKDKTVKQSSQLVRLDPFLDENGVLRVGGRLTFSELDFNKKHQVLVPRDSNVASLLINHFHSIAGHVGRVHVLALLRERYWITKANSLVRSVLNNCFQCRKQHGALGQQKMADLPSDRVTSGMPPFSFVGIDYFGPFMVKRGRSSIKRYGVLFTCLNLRAIHIEIAHTLDTSSFIQALRRFISRRGPVVEIRSDNGTNFVGANKELKELIHKWNQNSIHTFLLQKQIKWIFNTPAASHHGGVWERSIRSVRRILCSVVKEQTLDDESLVTYMCEVENVINSRPITCSSDDVKDPQPLTPNMLLHIMKTDQSLPPGEFNSTDVYSRKRWKCVQYLADLFWKRWVREYLPLLQRRQKWTVKHRNFTCGDIVLIADHNLPRNAWKLGTVIDTQTDKHGLVRSANIKTATSLLKRPITKLCLLSAAENI